jgi:hypothetical protein
MRSTSMEASGDARGSMGADFIAMGFDGWRRSWVS